MNTLNILRDEIVNDPLGRGYNGMTDEQIAVSLNTVDVVQPRTSITPQDIMQAIDIGEWPAVAAVAGAVEYLTLLVSAERISVNASNVQAALINNTEGIFRNDIAPTTRANIIALASETVSRASQLGLGTVLTGWVTQARAL